MIRKRIPSSMTKYNYTAVRYQVDAQALLRITQHKSLENLSLLINAQHYSLFQITMSPIEACRRCLSRISSILQATVMTVDHSMSGVTAWMFVDIDCNRNHMILRLYTCYTISRLGVQSRDWNAISKFWECPTQSQDCTNSQIAQNINIHTYIHTCVQTRTDCAARLWASH